MTLTHHIGRHVDTDAAPTTQHPWRTLTVVLLGAVAVLYAVVFAIQVPHLSEPDNPAPVYAVLSLAYVFMTVLAARIDTSRLLAALAAVQVLVLGLFAWSVNMVYAEGDEAFLLDMRGLAVAITLTQVVLLALLSVRAWRRR